jgi:uncharacterized repeat protein (TIGR03806 family)
MKRLRVAAPIAAIGLVLATACPTPPSDGEPSEGEGEGEAGEGEGEAGEGEGEEGEGEGEGEGDPNVPGLDARPSNTTCVARPPPVTDTEIDVVEPWPDLELDGPLDGDNGAPLFMLQEPGTSTMYVIKRSGVIVRFDKNDATVTTPEQFGDIRDRVETSDFGNDEQGLLGMAFHPDWPVVEEVFLSYTFDGAEGLTDRVSRFTLDGGGLLDEGSETVVLDFGSDFANHNGGFIAFSPTDACVTCLYWGTGDGGDGNDQFESAQDPGSFLGKILRIDVDGNDGSTGEYGIPDDNPFVGDDSFLPEVWALGLRNPWRWSFDRASGDLWLGDVGQNASEEIDFIERGGNYGWDVFEGRICRGGLAVEPGYDPEDCEATFDEPVVTYENNRVAVVGGYVYRGASVPALQGTYLFAEFGLGDIFAVRFDANGNASRELVLDLSSTIASFAEDADGELYVLDHASDTIRKIVEAGPPVVDTFPRLLSETGCADAANPALPSSGLVPFTVNHPLWSDGADKDRFLGLPDGTQATITATGDIDFPIGTVLRKDFRVQGTLTETRLFMRHDDGEWAGYSYEWNDAGTDATLVDPAGKSKNVGAAPQLWSYPSRSQCLQCHSAASGRTLGPELAQLDGTFTYAATGRTSNQLVTWDSIGLFDTAVPAPLPQRLVDVDDAQASVEDKARSYLHVNCAICHQPGGNGAGGANPPDMRFTTAFGAMNLCGVSPSEGDLGATGALRFAPADPAQSLVSLRMKREGAGRMPKIGSNVVDTEGTALIDNWITSHATCP